MSVESLGKDSKDEVERRIVTPWHSRLSGVAETLLTLSPVLSKLFPIGVVWEGTVSLILLQFGDKFCDEDHVLGQIATGSQ